MDIRRDAFSNVKDRRLLKGLVYRTHEAFNALFSTEEEVTNYVNSFADPRIAELFLEVGDYYHSAKYYSCPNCFPPKRIEKCPHCKNAFEMPAYIVLIMIISIMEKLSLGLGNWKDFIDWLGKGEVRNEYQELLRNGEEIKGCEELISSLKKQWRKEYGSSAKITEFFGKFMIDEEKIELIKSIRYIIEAPELPPKKINSEKPSTSQKAQEVFENWKQAFEKEQQLMFKTDNDLKNYVKRNNFKTAWEVLPICFNRREYWKCYSKDFYGHGQGYCRLNYACSLPNDKKSLDRCFNKTIKTIYDWRSKFVHQITLPPIRETSILSSYYKGKPIIVELTIKDFRPVFEKMLKRYFDQFLTETLA